MISVIIPVYNAEAYLGQCIESICKNTYRDLEIICINDGSTDGSLNILQELAQQDARIRIISNEAPSGPSTARNMGLDAAKGDWIACVDADDAVNELYFETLLEAAHQAGEDVGCVLCGRVGFKPNFEGLRIFEGDNQRPRTWKYITPKTFVATMHPWCLVWGRIYKAELIGTYRNPPGLLRSEDIYLNLNVLLADGFPKIVSANAAVYYYRWNPSSITHTLWGEKNIRCKLASYEKLAECAQGFPSPISRSIIADVLSDEAFCSYRESRHISEELTNRTKALFSALLAMWTQAGFISAKSRLKYLKYRLYRLCPNLAKAEDAFFSLHGRLRKMKHTICRKKG